MSRRPRFARTRWSDVWFVAVVIVGGSLLPLPLERRPEFERFGPDKALHLLGYTAFAVRLTDALVGEGMDPAPGGFVAVSSSAAIAVGTGRLQRYVPGRAHERADVVAGVLGACIGALWRAAGPAKRRPRSTESSASASEGRAGPEGDRSSPPY